MRPEEICEPRTALPDAELLASAGWFPESFDPRRGRLRFVATDRAELASQNFLDWRWNRTGRATTQSSVETLIAQISNQNVAPALIWHTGFCCSTLIAKALDLPGRNLSLREPQILVEIANAGRAGHLHDQLALTTGLALSLLSRRFTPEEHVTLKPSPAANILLRDPASRAGPMLFLYSDCRSFLISVVKLGEQGRKYVRSAFLAMLADGHAPAKCPPQTLLAMSDLEIAASLWHMQIAEIRRNWMPGAQGAAASLDCDAFLASPAEALNRIDRLLALSLGTAHVERVLAGPLFRRNAKTGEETFDAGRRQNEHRQIAEQLGGDLDRIVARSYELFSATPRGAPLPDSLLQCEKQYLP